MRRLASPLDAVNAVVWAVGLRVVEAADLEVALADDIVVADHGPRDRGQKDAVGGQVGSEVARSREELPWTDADDDEGADVAAATDGHEARE